MEKAAWIQAGATVVLVLITAYYAWSVSRQTKAARESANAAKKSAEATERMARLQSREARQEMVGVLHDLQQTMNYFRSQLLGWGKSPPTWEEMRSGAAPRSLGLKQKQIQEARESVAGLIVEAERRRTVFDSLDQLSDFQETADSVRDSHKQGEREVGAVNELEAAFASTRDDLETAIGIVGDLEDEIR